jgi:hypothetical protein
MYFAPFQLCEFGLVDVAVDCNGSIACGRCSCICYSSPVTTNTMVAGNESISHGSTMGHFIQFDLPQSSRDALADRRSPQYKAITFLAQDPQTGVYTTGATD